MSHFTLPVSAGGPILDAFVGVSAARQMALEAVGQPVPALVRIRALVDAGATATCIDPTVPATLPTIPVAAVDLLLSQGFHALIGRDILRNCVFHYNGSTGLFTLAF